MNLFNKVTTCAASSYPRGTGAPRVGRCQRPHAGKHGPECCYLLRELQRLTIDFDSVFYAISQSCKLIQ